VKKDADERRKCRQLFTSNTHNLGIVILVFYNLMSPQCEGSYPLAYFYDNVCFYSVDTFCVKIVMITCGFMAYEIMFFRPMSKEILLHHIFGIICIGSAAYTGYSMTGLAVNSLLCEFSTVFLNYRLMVSPE
jgi:hypothetical protein